MRKTIFLLIIALTGIIILFLKGENNARNPVTRVVDESLFENGDLVLRRGKGLISDLFCNASLYKRNYSHAGFLFSLQNDWYVIHMIGNNKSSGFKTEKFTEFINEADNKAYAIYRYGFMKDYSADVKQHLRKLQETNPAFDDHFSFDTDHELYCSEMIYKTVEAICNTQLPVTRINDMTYVSIDNLYPESHSVKILEFTY